MISLCVSISLALAGSAIRVLAENPPHLSPDLSDESTYLPDDGWNGQKAQHYVDLHKRLAEEPPTAVRKMEPDDGQMFFLDYWGFSDGEAISPQYSNFSLQAPRIQPVLLPISNLTDIQNNPRARQLLKRDFQCPSDTTSCASIGHSDACCPTGLTCNIVSNTGQGTVGCCEGASCSGQISQCQSGYTSCEAFGGGCCIPGYACASGGCILTATETIVVTPTPRTTSTPTTSSISSTPPTTSPPTTTATTSTSSAPTCSSGFNSCPASLGGGCCPASMICGSSTSCLTSPTSQSTSATEVVPPNRPTSVESSTQALTSIPATTTGTVCPTGFYQCSAYYNAGSCCQVGRDCGMTSCPPSNPSTVLQSDGVTIVVGSAGAVATVANDAGNQKGACATGWFSCAASVGGNCCPTGFSCGTASCWMNATAGATQTGSTSKQAAGSGRVAVPGIVVVMAMVTTVVMVTLV